MQDHPVHSQKAHSQAMAGIETGASVLETNKVLRNTYMLLGLTLLATATTAGIAMLVQLPAWTALVSMIAAFIMIFVVHKTADSAKGIAMIFVFSGLMGLALGPMLAS